jgi:hypothetical protein
MLDQIVANNPGRVAPIQWHVDVQFPLHSPEGRLKFRQYPPPMNNGYYTPWLWVDGHERGSDYGSWASHVSQALTVPADIEIVLTGTYDQAGRTGQVQAELISWASLNTNANVYVVITEDSCYYVGPNGDPWHNHVCRDYIPDQNGTAVTVPALGRDTFVTDFTLDPSWNEVKCNIVVFLQNPTVQPDSTKPVYNGAQVPVMLFTGASEGPRPVANPAVAVVPNPCQRFADFALSVPAGERYRLSIFDASGKLVREFSGRGAGETRVRWQRDGEPAGIYVYRLDVGPKRLSGKLIVAD